jgi:hypothetical protein
VLRERQQKLLATVDHEMIGQILWLRHQGYSLREIAAEVGFSHGYVGRILKSEGIGQPPRLLKPALPKRPRNGQTAPPDFSLVSEFEARGFTVKDAWRAYAQGCAKPYVYTHFSTLYRRWHSAGAEESLDATILRTRQTSARRSRHRIATAGNPPVMRCPSLIAGAIPTANCPELSVPRESVTSAKRKDTAAKSQATCCRRLRDPRQWRSRVFWFTD